MALRGIAGPSGTSGPSPVLRGLRGTSGPSGIAGPSGTSGPSGIAGPSGTSGPSGIAGPSGTSGPSGIAGPSGTSGPSGIAGPSGTSGPTGITGATGATGVTGPTGPGGGGGGGGFGGCTFKWAEKLLPQASGYMPTTYANDDPSVAALAKVGGYAWAVPFPGEVRWCSASSDIDGMEVNVVEVWRAGNPVSPWGVFAFLAPIPPSLANAAAPGGTGLQNTDWDGVAYESTGQLAVIPGDEIRVLARNSSLTQSGNVAVSVGIVFTSNTGGNTLQSGDVPFTPK